VVQTAPSIQALGSLALFAVVLLAVPFALRVVLRARPLPPGPLRDRLEAYARRVGFTARDILVWPTARKDGGASLNAAVVGVVGPARYVFVTDGLLAALDEDEIEAVFAHEAGHGRRGHVLLFLAFSATVVLAGFLPGGLGDAFEALVAPVPPVLRGIAIVLLWMGAVLGWISRRFEQEADVFGVETLPPPRREDGTPTPPEEHPFVRALERIAAEVGGIREVTGWRHFSIADRVAFVREYLTDAAVRRRHKVRLAVLRGVLIVFPLLAVGAAAVRVPQDLETSRTRGMLFDLATALRAPRPEDRARAWASAARKALATGRTEDALRWYREALLDGADARVRREVAEALGDAGRPLGAALLR
jgi:Zn-dependent protease with chaperone function